MKLLYIFEYKLVYKNLGRPVEPLILRARRKCLGLHLHKT